MNFTNETKSARQVPAPALARGVAVLRLLENAPGLSLDRIAAQTNVPKASALRLLYTLCELGLVERSDEDKSYRARVRLVPIDTGDSMEERVRGSLARLARAAGHTAEWYVPSQEGLVLVQRCEPEAEMVSVKARIGFVRAWRNELDAVACVANAVRESGTGVYSGYWTYDAEGLRRNLSMHEAAERLAQARARGVAHDEHYNTNGVRRAAVPVVRDRSLAGVLAIAASYRPGGADDLGSATESLTKEARYLGT